MPFLGWEAMATRTDRVLWVLFLPSCLPGCVGTRAQWCQQAPEQPLLAFSGHTAEQVLGLPSK